MRSLLLVLFACLARASNGESVVRAQEVKYGYDVQIVTGSPQSSKLTSGIRLSTDLFLFFYPNMSVVAQLRVLNLYKLDKFVDDHTAMLFMQPEDKLLDGIETNIGKVMIQQLEQVFSFSYVSGMVTKITFKASEPEYSTNIKRGLLSLFVVNLDKTFSVENVAQDKSNSYNSLQASYTVWEDSTAGYCRTVYSPSVSELSLDEFYLNKVRQYDSCIEPSRMSYVYDNFGPKLDKDEPQYNHLNMQGEVSYAIKGNLQDFTIETAVGQGKVVFTPYGPAQGTLITSINQTLVLKAKEVKEPRDMPPQPKGRMQSTVYNNLKMSLPVEMTQNLEPYIISNSSYKPYNPTRYSVQKMQQLLTIIANGTDRFTSDSVLLTMQTLIEMIRQSTNETLQSLWNAPINPDQHLYKLEKKILWQLLTSAATTSASELLLTECLKVTNKYEHAVNHNICISTVTNIGLFTPPSEQVIEKMLFVWKSSMRIPQLHDATTLALGAITGRAEDIVLDIFKSLDNKIAAIEEILAKAMAGGREDELKQTLKNLQDRKDDILHKHRRIESAVKEALAPPLWSEQIVIPSIVNLQALRNAHIPDSAYYLCNVLDTTQFSPIIRIIAAQALETFTQHNTDIAMKALDQVQKNPTEQAAIRIQAFRSMINLQPSVQTLIWIAGSNPYEQDRQVSTYTWSVFNQLSNSSFAPYRKLAGKLRASMPFIQPKESGIQDSQYRQWMTTVGVNVTLLNELNYVNDRYDNIVAETATYVNIFGTTNQAVRISVVSEGVQKVMTALFGAEGFLTNRESLFDLFKRTKRDTDVKALIDDIVNKLKIKLRELPDPQMRVSVLVYNKIIRSYDLTQFLTNLEELLTIYLNVDEDRYRQGVPLQYQASGIISPFFMEIRTEAGVPVHMQAGVSYTQNTTAELSGEVVPSLYKDDRGNQPPGLVTVRLAANQQMMAAVTGKMWVDGYLYQAGTLVSGLTNILSPFVVNATYNISNNRFILSVSPPVGFSPVVKLETKPYVYSQAVANDIPKENSIVQNVNQRPIFRTMQPVMVTNGARLRQHKYSFGKYLLGYDVTYQAQYPWRALPFSTASPLLGRSNYALYIKPGVQQPAAIVLDAIYKTTPRYKATVMRPTDNAPVKVGACDSWFFFLCYSTAESNAVDKDIQVDDSQAPPLTEPPNMDSKITVESIKQKFEKELGQNVMLAPSSSEWALLAVLNTSTSTVKRSVTLTILMQAWEQGRYHDGRLTVYRTPLPDYDPHPWKMVTRMKSLFPSRKYTVYDLLQQDYQRKVAKEAMNMSRRHKGNMFFQQHLVTHVSNYAIQRLPSLEPQIILDRIVPEFVLSKNKTLFKVIQHILKSLLPLSLQLRELKDRYKDPVSIKEALLSELITEAANAQGDISKLLEGLILKSNVTTDIAVATEYTVLKSTQVVLDLNAIVNRLAASSPLKTPLERLNKEQSEIYKDCTDAFSDEIVEAENEQSKDFLHLVWEQLRVILNVFYKYSSSQPVCHSDVASVISHATANITVVNNFLKTVDFKQNTSTVDLLLQAASQHQILVLITQQANFKSVAAGELPVSASEHYALKVQTKQLLERGSLVQQQAKLDKVCTPELATQEEVQSIAKLKALDRCLMTVQHDRITLPTQDTPWTGSFYNLSESFQTLNDTLKALQFVRKLLLTVKSQPHPCLLTKLFDTVSNLQQKISIFKRILLAQNRRSEMATYKFDLLDDKTMAYLLSLTQLFQNHVPIDSIYDIDHAIYITETTLKIEQVKQDQERLIQKLGRFFVQTRNSQLVERVMRKTFSATERLLKQLTSLVGEVQNEMHRQNSEEKDRVYVDYVAVLSKQNQIYNLLISQHEQYKNTRQDYMPQFQEMIREKQKQVGKLATATSDAALFPTTASPHTTLLMDIANDFPIYSDEGFLSQAMAESSSDDDNIARVSGSPTLPPLPPPLPDFDGILINANISIVTENKEMTVKVVSRKSLAQNLWEISQYYPESRDDCVSRAVSWTLALRPEQERCLTDTDQRLNNYNNIYMKFDANWNLSSSFKKVDRLIMNLHNHFYDRATDLDADQTIPEYCMHVVVDVTPTIDALDVFFLKREAGLVIESIPILSSLRPFFPFQNTAPYKEAVLHKASKRYLPPTCVLEEGTVRTNDGAVYVLPYYSKDGNPDPNCRNLLAMDCSPDKTFAITGTVTVWDPYAQVIEILAEGHQVNLIPEVLGDAVQLDKGNASTLPYPEHITITKEVAYGKEVVAVSIRRPYESGPIIAEYPLVGLLIVFDYSYVSMEMSSIYKRKLCGLCGNFDGQLTKELEGPRGRNNIYYAAQDFFHSYAIPEGQCPASSHRHHHGARESLRARMSRLRRLKLQSP